VNLEPNIMDSQQPSYHAIVAKLHQLRQRKKRVALLNSTLLFFALALGAGLILLSVESLLQLPRQGRWILDALALVGMVAAWVMTMGGALVSLFFRPASPSNDDLAVEVGAKFPDVRDRLVNALQVYRKHQHNPEGYSLELADASLAEVATEVHGLEFSRVVDWSPTRKRAKAAAAVAVASVITLAGFSPSLEKAAWRLTHPSLEVIEGATFRLTVEPGNVEVLKGSNVTLRITSEGEPLSQVTLHLARVGTLTDETKILSARSPNRFAYEIAGIKDSTEYFVEAKDVKSPAYLIAVIEPPLVRRVQVKLTYPAYSRMGTRTLDENVGEVTALKGTIVRIEATANKSIEEAALVFNDGTHKPMKVLERELRGEFVLSKDGSYRVQLTDSKGHTNPDPIDYPLSVIEDQFPIVKITTPGEDIDLDETMRVPLIIEAEDDFGFSRLRLGYKVIKAGSEGDGSPFSYVHLAPQGQTAERVVLTYDWDLSAMNLMPEDVVEYFAEVYDNDTVSGPKRAQSAVYRVRFPSIYEIYQEVAQGQEEVTQSLQEAYERSKALKERLEQFSQKMKRDPHLNWQQRKDLEEAVETQKELREEIEKATKALDEIIQRIEKNDMVTVETLEKYMELQRLLEEIATPELRQALEQLRKALEQLDPEQLKKAVENFNFNQEEFLKSIERTLAMLKQLQMEQKLDEIVKKTQELLQRQLEINEETQKRPEGQRAEDLALQEQQIQQDTKALHEALGDLSEKMAEVPNMPAAQLDSLAAMMQKRELSQKMQSAASMLQQGQMKNAQQMGQQISGQLSQMMAALKSAQQQMVQSQKKEVMHALRQASQDLLTLSKRQEGLIGKADALMPSSGKFPELADQQQEMLSGLGRVAEQLYQLSQKTFFVTPEIGKALGRARAEMGHALQNLEERNGPGASRNQGQAMAALNEAVKELRQSMNSLAGASSAIGLEEMMQRLQAMAAQQQGINLGTLELSHGGPLTLEEQAALQRLAAQQQALRKSLEQLQKEMGNRSEILGRLDQVARDMEQVTEDLQKQNVNRQLIERQRRILSRLLDAQRSMRERDYSPKRQAETARTLARRSPGELPRNLGEREMQWREDLLRAMKEGYTKDYLDLIKQYFEALAKTRSPH